MVWKSNGTGVGQFIDYSQPDLKGEKEMRRDYKTATKIAVNGLYSGEHSEMEEALREILEILDPNMAELYDNDYETAHLKANDGEISTSDEDETEVEIPEEY
jgi:hypothetical protein